MLVCIIYCLIASQSQLPRANANCNFSLSLINGIYHL